MYDVLVIGGGPAGASVATWLAKAGFQVGLLDRARFPRDKACGEFLTPPVRHLLTDLGVWDAVCRAGVRPVRAAVLCAPDGGQARHTSAGSAPVGYALRRITLDSLLLQQAQACGVEVREGFAARALLRNAHGHVIGLCGRDKNDEPITLRARLVIGADGAHSLVARQLAMVRPLPRLQRVALVSHWRNVAGPADVIEMRAHGQTVCGLGFPGPSLDLPPLGLPEGLTGRFPANLTLVVPTASAARIAGRAGDFVEETLQTQFPDLVARLAGAEREAVVRTVGCFGHVCRPTVAEGALLVGDAATFIDPFTGEGVYFALRGAQLAAEVVTHALHQGRPSHARLLPYARARRELVHRYLLCDIVQAVVRVPSLLSTLVRRLDRRSGLADRLLGVLGDMRPPTDALHPGFLWRLLAPEV